MLIVVAVGETVVVAVDVALDVGVDVAVLFPMLVGRDDRLDDLDSIDVCTTKVEWILLGLSRDPTCRIDQMRWSTATFGQYILKVVY